MGTGNDTTSTLREISATRSGRAAARVLLIRSFVPDSGRVLRLERPITIGRGRPAAGGTRKRDADGILHSDSSLSRKHLRIDRDARIASDDAGGRGADPSWLV